MLTTFLRRVGRAVPARSARRAPGRATARACCARSLRTALLLLLIPALIWDRDGRGLHDKVAGTRSSRVALTPADQSAESAARAAALRMFFGIGPLGIGRFIGRRAP